MDKLEVQEFIEILGCKATDTKIKIVMEKLGLVEPLLNQGEDTFWYELENEGFDLAFKDESIINKDEYADIGDGELIFMTAYFNKFDNIVLPFQISKNDNFQKVVEKVGRKEDDRYDEAK